MADRSPREVIADSVYDLPDQWTRDDHVAADEILAALAAAGYTICRATVALQLANDNGGTTRPMPTRVFVPVGEQDQPKGEQ